MCSKRELNEITKAVRGMYDVQYRDALKEVLLYGSYARGDHTDSSDIDIAGIVDGERSDLQKKLKRIWDETARLGYQHNVIISPVVIPLDEFEKYQDILPFYRNIKQEGIRVE